MKRRWVVALAVMLAAPFMQVTSVQAATQHGSPPPAGSGARPACGPPASAQAQCHAEVVTRKGSTTPLATNQFTYGWAPSDLISAYKLPTSNGITTSGGSGQVIAIVDAYDDPTAEVDLQAYRSQFGLGSCTTANGCFKKVNQRGGTSYPAADTGWAQEISLDVDMASAVCPNCHILLVEADSNSFSDLSAAVTQAARMASPWKATEISNSYGSSQEFSGETSYDSAYNQPGIVVTVSSGDNGYNRFGYPAASPYVTAVGGTSLSKNTSAARGWSETAWSGAGSGCSRYESKRTWQKDGGCSKRTVADVAAVADPNTGVAVYDSYGSSGGANWLVFGGTSVSSPIIAAVYALAGNASSVSDGSWAYSHTGSLFDITSGSNGGCGRTRYLCTAGPGYDGPTGLGTPNGIGGF